MRIWSFHPSYLDSKGLVALWRETLLAQNVLMGKTKGYKNHPQLIRFKHESKELSIQLISNYLHSICDEADQRGYQFTRSKIEKPFLASCRSLFLTRGQLEYEWMHLMKKLERRDLSRFKKNNFVQDILIHPLFQLCEGKVEGWEKT